MQRQPHLWVSHFSLLIIFTGLIRSCLPENEIWPRSDSIVRGRINTLLLLRLYSIGSLLSLIALGANTFSNLKSCVHVHVCMHMCVGEEGAAEINTNWIVFLSCLVFWEGVSHWTSGSPIWANQASQWASGTLSPPPVSLQSQDCRWVLACLAFEIGAKGIGRWGSELRPSSLHGKPWNLTELLPQSLFQNCIIYSVSVPLSVFT